MSSRARPPIDLDLDSDDGSIATRSRHWSLLLFFFWFRRWARAAPTTDEKEEAESMSLVNEVCAPFQVWQQVMRSEGASAFSAQEV